MEEAWYAGTADAVFQNIDLLRRYEPDYVLILAGDHVYKMDYARMLAEHIQRRAEITIAAIEVPIVHACDFGVMRVDESARVLQFDERHQTLMPAGRHELIVVSRELGYRDSRVVDVKPGEVTRLSIEPPRTTLTVTAMAPAQVWLDGTHIGAAPLVDVPIDLGTHQIVVRHPTAGEERRTIAATSAPNRVEVDFGKQN